MRTALKNKREAGFSLIVVAVVTLLLGICVQFGVGFFKTETETERELATEKKIARLTAQLSSYAQQYNRIPCPASPAGGDPSILNFGIEDTTTPGTTTACNRTEGIVPYRTLGIEPTEATDSWGRYITYAISPVFADTLADPDNVHFRCRTENWRDALNGVNTDGFKARFCCPDAVVYGAATDIQITGEPVLNRDTLAANIADADTLSSPPFPAGSPDAWAVVVLSHGRNGHGAFIGNTTANKHLLASFGTAEGENADADNTFQTVQRSYVPGNNYFDDIISYRTQSQLYAQLNSGTCIMP